MAMSKKEKASIDERILRLERQIALRWTEGAKKDVPPPDGNGNQYSFGWDFNAYNDRVVPCWSSSVSHGWDQTERGKTGVGSQNSRHLFSSKVLALMALRRAAEEQSAERLRKIDEMIKAEGG